MKQVRNFKETDPLKNEYYFDITLEDGHISTIKVIKEMGEYVLVGDDRQHFCESELNYILGEIKRLNSKIYRPSICNNDYEDDEDEEEEDYED